MYNLLRNLFWGTPIQSTKFFEFVYRTYVQIIQRKLPQEQSQVVVPFRGLHFAIDKGDITMLPSLIKGSYEERELDAMSTSFKAGSTILDVGANIGVYSALAAVHPKVDRVISFEPNPRIAAICRRNIDRLEHHNRAKCEVHEVAVSSSEGQASFVFSDYHGTGHLVTAASDRSDISVSVTTLDSFITQRVRQCENMFIKIDVEGFEPNVILGASQLIAQHQPTLLVEVCGKNSDQVGASWKDAIALLASSYDQMKVLGHTIEMVGSSDEISTYLRQIVRDGRLHNVFFTA